jgi:GTP pyrophosphokinase
MPHQKEIAVTEQQPSDRTFPDATSIPPLVLGPRFEDALVYAAQLHAGQVRKGTEIPYLAHLLSVAALVLEAGGDEEQAIAALLHDAVEDQGGLGRLRAIRGRYGERVARIVLACSDAWTEPKPPWPERKARYLARLPHTEAAVLLVSAADKLHNARAILTDVQEPVHGGDALFARFTGGKDGTLWYYTALVAAYQAAGFSNPLVRELARVVRELTAVTVIHDRAAGGDEQERARRNDEDTTTGAMGDIGITDGMGGQHAPGD